MYVCVSVCVCGPADNVMLHHLSHGQPYADRDRHGQRSIPIKVVMEEAMLESSELEYNCNRHRPGCRCCFTCEVYAEMTKMDVEEVLYDTNVVVVAETESSSDV